MDYVTVPKTLQTLTNDETKLPLTQIGNKSVKLALCGKCKTLHPSYPPYHRVLRMQGGLNIYVLPKMVFSRKLPAAAPWSRRCGIM